MAETKAEELSRLMYEIEGLNDSVTTNMALLGFELLPIGYFGKAKKAAQAPIATASRELAPRVQSQVAEDVSRLGNLESLEEFYLGQITGRKNKKKVMAQEISGAKSKSKASKRKLMDRNREISSEFITNEVLPKLEQELFGRFEKAYNARPKGGPPISLEEWSRSELKRLDNVEDFSKEFLPFEATEAIADRERPFGPFKHGSELEYTEGYIAPEYLEDFNPAKLLTPKSIDARNVVAVEYMLDDLKEIDKIRENPGQFVNNFGDISLEVNPLKKLELDKKRLSDPEFRELAEQRNLDYNRVDDLDQERLDSLDPMITEDNILLDKLNKKVLDNERAILQKKIDDSGYNIDLGDSLGYEPDEVINLIKAGGRKEYEAGMMPFVKNYAKARATFMYSMLPVVPTAVDLYSDYTKRSELQGKVDELKSDMSPDEIEKSEFLLLNKKGTSKYLGPDSVSIPGSSMVRAEYPVSDTERPVTPDTFGKLSKDEEMSVIEFINSMPIPDKIPEYNEEDAVLYESFTPKKKR